MVLVKLFAVLVLGVAVVVNGAPRSRVVGDGIQHTLTTETDITSCEKVEKYSTEWFLQNTKPEYTTNLLNTALFYSHGMSSVARQFAKLPNNKMTTIWDIWPCYLYNHHTGSDNPMRCIHANDTDRQFFFENMSRAFAMKARNFSTVLHSSKNYGNPPTTGIWAMVEFPALSGGGHVDLIEKTNENKSMSEIFWRSKFWLERLRTWKRSLVDVKARNRKVRDRSKREPSSDDASGYCLRDKELGFFDQVDW